MELLVIFRGLQLCVPMGLHRLMVESDSQSAIQAINDGERVLAQYATLIREIQALSMKLQEFTFNYGSRMGNQVAHTLPRITWKINELHVWWGSIPVIVKSFVWLDASFDTIS